MAEIEISDSGVSVGYIYVSRKIVSHPYFLKKPFDQFHAFIWLLLNARYSDTPTTQYVGSTMVTWSRGQLPASVRFLAEAFGWTKKKVENWLAFLEKDGTIKRATTRTGTVIELINYEMYQKRGQVKGQQRGQQKNESNPLPARDSAGSSYQGGDTNRDSNGDTEETAGGHEGDKTVSKEVIQGVINEKKRESKSHALSHSENFNNEELDIIRRFRLSLEKYPAVMQMQQPFSDQEIIDLTGLYSYEVIGHYISLMENKGLTNAKSPFWQIKNLIKNEKSDSIKGMISGGQLQANKRKQLTEYNSKIIAATGVDNSFLSIWIQYKEVAAKSFEVYFNVEHEIEDIMRLKKFSNNDHAKMVEMLDQSVNSKSRLFYLCESKNLEVAT